jgi:hypothetical protein
MTIDPDVLETAPIPCSEARELIQNGDIALFHGNEPFSRLIETYTHGPFSHVGFVWRMDDIDRVGCPYSAHDIDGIAARIVTGFAGVSTAKDLAPSGSYICSEHA